MRTLKKTLSLVLVVAMVLGLCVVGASAKDAVENFTDDYQKVGAAYQEAVGVLVGVGIIDGMTETALEPQGSYTREQAAKIIAYMLLGKSKADSLKCTVAPFDDVAASRWSAGYIAFCVEQGIIDGMTATTYEPTGTLTGFQWAKMLLCAIGFGVKGEFTGSSWSVNTALVAHKVKAGRSVCLQRSEHREGCLQPQRHQLRLRHPGLHHRQQHRLHPREGRLRPQVRPGHRC